MFDYLVNFAQSYGKRLHGHALIWYKQSTYSMPTWVQNFQGTKEEWKQIMKEYITDVVTRYKGKVASWDVVNEAVKDDGTFRPASECVWTKNIGVPEYIDWAFQCAHEADPNALLFYNDYGHEYSSAKRVAINNLIKGMKERGVPIHGYGLQMHTNVERAVGDLRNAILTAAQTGLKVHVSELDIAVNKNNVASLVYSDELKQKQYLSYKAVAEAMADVPEGQQYGITTWGVADPNSWLYANPDWPLPFDGNYQRKPAYQGLVDGFY
ncbi:MAG: endo-1,4-beta-xylanase [Breznakibacter sp.]